MKSPTSSPTKQHADTQLAMTSMIDVVFLLLVFFVWTSSFDLPEQDLTSGVAKQTDTQDSSDRRDSASGDQASVPDLIDEVVVRISQSSGQTSFEIGTQRFSSLKALAAHFQKIANLGIDVPVVIDPSPSVEMQVAIGVLDAARRYGLRRVYFAAA